jgi:hypothetical protein
VTQWSPAQSPFRRSDPLARGHPDDAAIIDVAGPLGTSARNSRSSTCSEIETVGKLRTKQLVVCVNNEGYPASLEKRKIYVALRDAAAEKHGLLRIHS